MQLLGHELRWQAVQRAYAKAKIPQTLLISGPPHVGKRTFARAFARLVLCPNASPQSPQPCDACRVCHQVKIETFPDFKVYKPLVGAGEKDVKERNIAPRDLEGSVLPIAIAREFGEEAMMKPLVGARKVMLIESVDRLTIEAQNALLKTFEEPVTGLSIVLLTDNAAALLPTVLSRAWHLPLGITSQEKILLWLREQFPDAEQSALDEAARVSGGRAGAAFLAVKRLQDEEAGTLSRYAQTQEFVARIQKFGPVGALALSEEAQRLARTWWDEDVEAQGERTDKGAEAKATRSALARFLDELANAYREKWASCLGDERLKPQAEAWARGLDLIGKTRHYLLHNANGTLALDVLFGRLIALSK